MTDRYLTPLQTARRFGISAKALRLYEARGLVQPERTPADWRVYGPVQIARLQQVIALKSFGLSLADIARLLSGRTADLTTFLALHEDMLRRQGEEVARALALVTRARARLADGDTLSANDLIDLTRKTTMTNSPNLHAAYQAIAARHLTPQDEATLAQNGYAPMAAPDPVWTALWAEATRLMAGHAPESVEAMDLARRWMTQVFTATGGDTALTKKVREVARDMHNDPDIQTPDPSSLAMMDYIGKAYGAAIAAGIMPRPE